MNRQITFNFQFVARPSYHLVDLNEIVGNFSTSKKSELFK